MLAQKEADRLMELDKICESDDSHVFPDLGKSIQIGIISVDYQDHFILNIYRGRIVSLKCTYQERYRGTPLIRLDLNPHRHCNPYHLFPPPGFENHNGEVLTCSHVHLYREGFGDKYAMPAEKLGFKEVKSVNDLIENLSMFFDYCKIVEPPIIQEVLE